MLFIILGSLVLLALLDRTVRGGRIRLAELDFRFGLFEIRDVLRDAAINEEISYSKWFDYMDTTLTRTLDAVQAVNPWMAAGYGLIHRNDRDVKVGLRELEEALARPENKKIARVYAMYTECLNRYLKARFPVSLPLAAMVSVIIDRDQRGHSVQEEERKLAPVFSVSPETSTFSEYVVNRNPSEVVQSSTLALQ
jgi:hypothetical protein